MQDYLYAVLETAIIDQTYDHVYVGTIPGIPEIIATGETPEACGEDLADQLGDYVETALREGRSLPDVEGVAVPV
jgi:predicted RNase H-like HicB family nuclease